MALKAEVYPNDTFDYQCSPWGFEDNVFEDDVKALLGILEAKDSPTPTHETKDPLYWISATSSPEEDGKIDNTDGGCQRKRRRTKATKNKEDIENQRMTHIAVERNRRRQMNEYLAVLRSLMPPSYVQRGDQASIIGGAINYVKELEQVLQMMEVQKKKEEDGLNCAASSCPFSGHFTFPQYSSTATEIENKCAALADIKVTMVESHGNLKILAKRRPRQLVKIVNGLQILGLSILHLNLAIIDDMAFHSVSVKVEEGCKLQTVDEIASAVNQMILAFEEDKLN